ncbi:MAG TPA: response regulator [Rhodopila sp.]|jgi:two-component system response regulator FixJ|nr:response regulator [Rhodopila sp.]
MADQRHLVLIVDDDQAVRDSLEFALRLEGLCVHVHSGAAALLADPDLNRASCVVVNDRIPPADSFELLGRLQASHAGLSSILLTSHATPRIQARADAAGVSKVLEKPLLGSTLIDSIRTILNANP